MLTPAVAIACGAVVQAPAQVRDGVSQFPEGARLVTSDVRLFWNVYDRFLAAHAGDDTLAFADLLETDYLALGTGGLRDFIPNRILSGEDLARRVLEDRDRYQAVRESSLALLVHDKAIRATFYAMEYLYPDAVYPNVYFVIGRLNSGGTVSERGLLLGAEMYRNAEEYVRIVAHELIHFQQPAIPPDTHTLLAQSIREGSADFVAELISGRRGHDRRHEYGLTNEAALWKEFTESMHRVRDWNGWLYGGQPENRPPDLGYFVGYQIAEAYFERMTEKRQAIRDIIEVTDFEAFLERSGYDPRRSDPR